MIADPTSPVCRKPAGGVAAVELSAAANIRDIEFEEGGGLTVCSLLNFADNSAVMRCELLEERSSFVETLTADGSSVAVKHTLKLVADRNMAQGWLEPRFISEAMCGGIVALVTLADGRRFIAGVSRKFGLEQPLRLKSITVDSGRSATDEPEVILILESFDTAFASTLEA